MRIKKLLISTLVIISSIILLTGCLEQVELNKLGIVAGLGVDKTDDGYILTVQILKPSAVAGETQNKLPTYNLQSEGQSIQEAWNRITQVTSSALYLSHLNVVVINEEFAKDGFSPILNFALRHSQIRPDISVVIAKNESANDILSVVTALDMIPATQLDVEAMVPTHTGRLANYNLYDTVDIINTNAANIVLNAVSILRDDKHLKAETEGTNGKKYIAIENGTTTENVQDITIPVELRIKHLAVFQGDKLVGYIDDKEASFYNIIMGNQKRYSFVSKIDEDYYTSVGSSKIESEITTDLANNEATIKINFNALIIENTYPIDLTNTENLKALSQRMEDAFKEEVEDFIKKVQTELKSDIFGIGGKAYHQETRLWREIEGYWPDIFPDLTINLEVELKIDSIGEIGNVTL